MKNTESIKPIVITPGDPAGIGPEIVAKAFRDAPDVMAHCFVLGDLPMMQRAADLIGGISAHPISQAGSQPSQGIPVLALNDADPLLKSEHLAQIPYRAVSDLAGIFSYACVREAARMALRGEAAAVVTAPIHKEAWGAAGVKVPGHTELLQHEAAAFAGMAVDEMPVRMMLASDELRTVLVSIHVSLREALDRVTHENVLQTLRITHAALSQSLRSAPRIAVAGLNPHAGEGGLFGREEIEVIHPAIAAAKLEGINAQGSFPPDTIFMQARGFRKFDAVIAMYHDQGLIPVKYLGVEKGVNVTLGLHNGKGQALVRTSPDHGTAFDIAGQGVADASSLVEAVKQARALI
ncbi:4-hydroxythreonine-4-phosphate dehydrogenase PdxA [Variovorax sp. PCZ-1]|uniref:4-hydroxythreonine-4-phosphate dehydrogenase PdxA n=1 Tax=Variovorax sp. PCZ-1 TaxID=2835533 RepID=UPI001BCF46C1|nr:4-hydroxythreonine-4-phosphate dehydrogenase PdxA [Variovorax sp. PCZ-1]MBS7808406.1 4-hydroxythreonine-4-phosphate dehydrogenase PdxA [Variovorax sp. PCZ-1]